MQAATPGPRPMQPQERADALDNHQAAERSEQQDIADRDRQLDLPQLFEKSEDPDPKKRADEAAPQQDIPHLEIDVAAPPMDERAGDRRTNELVGGGRDGHGRR